MTDNNINWDATAFFASLTEKNKFAKAHDFVFARVSGLNGFEEVGSPDKPRGKIL